MVKLSNNSIKDNILFYLVIVLINGFPLKTAGEAQSQIPSPDQSTQQQITAPSKEHKCINDQYTLEAIQKEISTLMKQNELLHPYSSEQVWRGIPLDVLPMSHVNYFFIADKVLSTDIDVSTCRSAPCVFNMIYNKSKDHIAGFTAFLFFLKTGYVLSGTSEIPRVDIPQGLPLSSFYFKNEELYLLWLWMKSTPHQFFKIKNLQYIYRFPHNMNMDSDPHACGKSEALLYTEETQGFILLPDCAFNKILSPLSHTGLGNIFTLFHEISHHYDFSLSFQHPLEKRYSEIEDFFTLSNWKREEHSNEHELMERWNPYSDEGKHDGFFRDYTKTSPAEDFADSLAGYRVYPKILQTTSPLKFQYFKERIFNGRDYTHQGNEEYYTSKISSLVQSQTQKWIPTCINTTDQVKENLSPLIFSQVTYNKFLKKGLLATHIRCLETKMQQEIKQLENQLKYNEFEACSFFANNERNWWHSIIQNHSDFFIAVLNDIDPKHIRNIDIVKFRNQIKKEFRSKGTAIHCHQNSATPSKCFTDHLKKHIKDVAKKHFYFNEDIISNELRRFYSLYSYSKTLQEVIHSTKHILQVTHSDIENTANKLVSYCSTQNQLNHSTKLIEPYKGPDGFFILETWFMNCININLKDYLKTLTINKKQNFNNPTQAFMEFVDQIYHNDLLSEINRSVYDIISTQYDDIKQAHSYLKEEAFQYFDNNPDWYKEYSDDESIFNSCLKHSQKIVRNLHKNKTLIVDVLPEIPQATCTELAFRAPHDQLFQSSFSEIFWHLFEREWILATKVCTMNQDTDSFSFSDFFEEELFQWECVLLEIIPSANKAWEQLNKKPTFQKYKHKKKETIESLIQKARENLSEFILKHLS